MTRLTIAVSAYETAHRFSSAHALRDNVLPGFSQFFIAQPACLQIHTLSTEGSGVLWMPRIRAPQRTVTLEHLNWLRRGSFECGHGAQYPQPAMSERPVLWAKR